jgi:hypothetical protein
MSLGEVRQMSFHEIAGWFAYFQIQDDKRK